MTSRETNKELALLATIVVALVVIAIAVPIVMRQTNDSVLGPKYAMMAGEKLVDFMRRNNDSWPSDWDELLRDRDNSQANRDLFEALRRTVVIDFDFKPTKAGAEGFVGPVRLASGANLNDNLYPDPNVFIIDYLKSRAESRMDGD